MTTAAGRRPFIAAIRFLALLALLASGGCQSAPARTLLTAPTTANATAAQHNEAGILAYEQRQWPAARQHFDAALAAAPDLAEAHYNLGMTLYKLGAMREGDAHFMKAADLAPGHKIIWDSPPLRNVHVPYKEPVIRGYNDGPGDGHAGHSH